MSTQLVTKAGAMRELFEVLDQLDTGQLSALTDYARELSAGVVEVIPDSGHALTEADSANWRLYNSLLGIGEDGQRVSSR